VAALFFCLELAEEVVMQQYEDIKMTAKRFGSSTAAFRKWTKQGMPHLRLGRLVRYNPDEVIQWFKERQQRNGKSSEVAEVVSNAE
jgi:phage terminase Nu1 subunit (DNA packaging protein)